MKYFGTTFSLTLVSLRLRIRIDLEDEPEDKPAGHHLSIPVCRKETAST